MASGLKKVGSAGRYGPRYGVRTRRSVAAVERMQKARYKCPRCEFESVKRFATGVWRCRHCGLKFAGGAYTPTPSEASGLPQVVESEEPEGGAAAAPAKAQD